MEKINTYASWGSNAVEFNPENKTFVLDFKNNKKAITSFKIDEINVKGHNIGDASIFSSVNFTAEKNTDGNAMVFSVDFCAKEADVEVLTLRFTIGYDYIELEALSNTECTISLSSDVFWGDRGYDNTYPISTKNTGDVIRCAIGPATSIASDALFDRLSDAAIKFSGSKDNKIFFSWDKKNYIFSTKIAANSDEKVNISFEKDILTNQFSIDYSPINKTRSFKLPPIGWMTWYAVKFDACEEKVLKNADWMSRNLKKFGANCVWVDWEWCHKDMSGSRSDGTDIFNPDKEKYPSGLKYLSEKIREMGLAPALWIGFTNESDMNEYLKDNPEIILVDEVKWCGRYFFDFSHPKYLNEFLPLALANVEKWGYDAVKYDTLPLSMMMHEIHHHKMYDSSLTTQQAYRNMILKTREVLGENCYMLACSGFGDSSITWACDIFDSARIGGDIFQWDEFLKEGVDSTLHYYPLHNNVMYLDCDNVVMREEFNNYYQSASRIYFVSMLGLPITFGDEFDALDEQRIDFIKSCIPVLDIHPTELNCKSRNGDILKTNLCVEMNWESYNVVNLFNTSSEKKSVNINFESDLLLPQSDYIIFDYSADAFLGIERNSFNIELEPYESKIICVRKKTTIPQVISTSRHITQGAAEINSIIWNNEANSLAVDTNLVSDNPYEITLYVPDNFSPVTQMKKISENIYKATFLSEKNESKNLIFEFKEM